MILTTTFAPNTIDIVMVAPRYAENIGAVARALANFGAGELVLVRPNELTREGLAQRVARAGEDRLERARITETLEEALVGYDLTLATSHRHGRHRRIFEPWMVATELVDVLHPQRVALVLGPEDHGLKRDEIDLCHHLVCIDAQTPLNVAQAAVVLLYEWCSRPRTQETREVGDEPAKRDLQGTQPTLPVGPASPTEAKADATFDTAGDTDDTPPPFPTLALTQAIERSFAAVGYPHHRRPRAAEAVRLASMIGRSQPAPHEFRFFMGFLRHLELLGHQVAAPTKDGPGFVPPESGASQVNRLNGPTSLPSPES